MLTQIKFEYRKIWNWVSIACIVSMCIISTLHTFIYLNLQWRTIDSKGKIVSGLPAQRALKEASKDIEGVMDEEYLQNLKEDYAVSIDKQYLDEHRGFLGTGGMTKYIYPNYCINYAYYSEYMSNGNDKIGLDYDFLDSEENFYKKYGEAMKEQILDENKQVNLKRYTASQIKILDQKLADIKTPFRVSYCQGISNFMNWYNIEYPIFFVVLAFALSCIYAKDSPSGVSELTLSTAKGRKENFRARWIAGNLFAVTSYILFVGVLLAEHGAIASLDGFNASAQTYWFNGIFNLSIGMGMILKIIGGLMGALVVANATILLSCILKNVKITSITAILGIVILLKLSNTYSQIKLLYPLQFSSDAVVKTFFFFGKILVPYCAVVLILTMVYVGIFTLLLSRAGKKYLLN